MGKPRHNWDLISDEILLDLRADFGSYPSVADMVSEILGTRVGITTLKDEIERRGIKGEWDSIDPKGGGAPSFCGAETWITQDANYFPPHGNIIPLTSDDNALKQPLPSSKEALKEENKELRRTIERFKKRDRLELRLCDRMAEEIAARGQYLRGSELLSYPSPPGSDQPSNKHSFCLLLSDAHFSEVVNLKETGGLGEYNIGIHDQRMLRLFDALCSFQDHRPYPIEDIYVFMLGDMLSGDIHDELQITNELPAVKAVIEYGEYMAYWLQMLESRFERVHVVGVSGNHPRLSKKPFNKQAFNTGDYLAYDKIRTHMLYKGNFSFDVPESNHHDIVLPGGWRFLLLHGQGVKSFGLTPESAIARRVKEIQLSYIDAGKPVDYVLMGHWHRMSSLSGTGIRVYVNGSIKGIDEYGLTNYGGGQPPEQTLLTVHPKHGVTDTSYINLEDKTPAGKRVSLQG